MPLTYAEYIEKRDKFINWTEYGRIVVPALKYLGAGMEAVANQLRTQSPELSQAFRDMGEAMFNVTGDVDNGYTRSEIDSGLRQLDGLFAFLDQSSGGVTNRQRLEQALEGDPGLKDRYLTSEESKNASFQQHLDSIGDFFVVSQRAIDAEIERDSRRKALAAYEQIRLNHQQRLETVDARNIPEEQKALEKQRIQREFEETMRRIEKGARYAAEQAALNEKLEQEKREAQEERDRQERLEQQRQEEERQRQAAEEKRQEEERLQRAAQRRQQKTALRQRQVRIREQEGPFSMPKGYDYRDAAIHFTRGMQSGKPEDSVVFKLADKIHAKRLALEDEVNGILAGVDRTMHGERYYEQIQKLPYIHDELVSKYGNLGLRDKLAEMEDGPEKEAKLFAEMKEEQLVTEARRSDLLDRYPDKAKLNKALEPHRVQVRRKVLEERLGKDLELRLRQKENELTAAALEEKFFLDKEYKENLETILKNTFGAELDQKMAKYAGEPDPMRALFHNEVYFPALRSREQWMKLGKAMGLPKEFTVGNTTENIPSMDVMAQIASKMVKPEEVEKALFVDLAELHPEEALYDRVQLASEEALYASLHPEEPKPNGGKLFDQWLKEKRRKLALEGKQEKLDELRGLDEAAEGLKKNCLEASKEDLTKKSPDCQDKLAKASRSMKDTAARLAYLAEKDPAQFKELAEDMDKEWLKMDLMDCKELREAQDIPEQHLHYSQPKPHIPWPFEAKNAGREPEGRKFLQYEYHAFDMQLAKEVWTCDKLEAENEDAIDQELEDAQNYTLYDINIEEDNRNSTDKFIDEEWNKLTEDRHMFPEEKQKILSRIVAADHLWKSGKENQPTEEQIDALAKDLRKQANFKQIVEYVDPKIFAKSHRVGLIEKCMEKTVPPQEKQDAQRAKLQQTAAAAAGNMLATKKGTSYFFGVSRFLTGNSTRYEHALGAIQEVQHNPDKDVGTAVETVKTYLQDKMKKRDREFGRVRWKQCMDFLKVAMPRKDFEDYCREVNRARRVNSIEDEDFVTPEKFGPPQTVKEMRDEIIERFRSGEGTRRDLTLLGAMKNLDLQPDVTPDLRQLLTEAGKIDNSPELGYIMSFGTSGQQVRLAEKLAATENVEEEEVVQSKSIIQSVGEQLQKNKGPKEVIEGLEDPVGLEKELLDIATEGKGVKNHMKNRDPKKMSVMKASDRKERESEQYIEEESQDEILLTN